MGHAVDERLSTFKIDDLRARLTQSADSAASRLTSLESSWTELERDNLAWKQYAQHNVERLTAECEILKGNFGTISINFKLFADSKQAIPRGAAVLERAPAVTPAPAPPPLPTESIAPYLPPPTEEERHADVVSALTNRLDGLEIQLKTARNNGNSKTVSSRRRAKRDPGNKGDENSSSKDDDAQNPAESSAGTDSSDGDEEVPLIKLSDAPKKGPKFPG